MAARLSPPCRARKRRGKTQEIILQRWTELRLRLGAKRTEVENGNWTAAEPIVGRGRKEEEVECDGGGFGELTHPWQRDLGWLSRGWRRGGGMGEGCRRRRISAFSFLGGGDEREGLRFTRAPNRVGQKATRHSVSAETLKIRGGSCTCSSLRVRCRGVNHIMSHKGGNARASSQVWAWKVEGVWLPLGSSRMCFTELRKEVQHRADGCHVSYFWFVIKSFPV